MYFTKFPELMRRAMEEGFENKQIEGLVETSEPQFIPIPKSAERDSCKGWPDCHECGSAGAIHVSNDYVLNLVTGQMAGKGMRWLCTECMVKVMNGEPHG